MNILNTNIDSFLDEYQLFIFENESKIQGVTLPILIYSSTDLYQPIKKIQKIKKKTNDSKCSRGGALKLYILSVISKSKGKLFLINPMQTVYFYWRF